MTTMRDTAMKRFAEFAQDEGWFDGSLSSVNARLAALQAWRERFEGSNDPKATKALRVIAKQEDELLDLCNTISDNAYISHLPGETVDHNTDGYVDDGSLIFEASSQLNEEINSYNWDKFVTVGAKSWVDKQSDALLSDKHETVKSASHFVDRYTAMLNSNDARSVKRRFLSTVKESLKKKTATFDVHLFQDRYTTTAVHADNFFDALEKYASYKNEDDASIFDYEDEFIGKAKIANVPLWIKDNIDLEEHGRVVANKDSIRRADSEPRLLYARQGVVPKGYKSMNWGSGSRQFVFLR